MVGASAVHAFDAVVKTAGAMAMRIDQLGYPILLADRGKDAVLFEDAGGWIV